MNLTAVLLALAASCFTALASVAQRRAAAPASAQCRFRIQLVAYLLRRPIWFLGIGAMIVGFVLQVAALRHGDLSVVQPVISTELVIVFACIAFRDHRRVRAREWIAAIGMVIGLAAFLTLAHPTGGSAHASGMRWVLAGLVIIALMAVVTALGFVSHKSPLNASRQAALFAVAAGTGFGFVAAVVKELSTHLHEGIVGVFGGWSLYVLLLSGALSMFLATNAFQAGPLAASQPGLTLVDPIVASSLGVVLFGERLNVTPVTLVGELCAICLIAGSVVALSRSPLIREARSDETRAPIDRRQSAGQDDSERRVEPRMRT